MNLQSFLEYDKNLLISLQNVIPTEYSFLVTIFAESIVIWIASFLVILWLYGVRRKDDTYKIRALQIFGLIIAVFLIYTVVNIMVPQWREHPHEFLLDSAINPLIPHPTDNSFPSGHALFSAAAIFAMWRYSQNKIFIAITIILAILTVCLRVLGGVHYPGDILGGLFFGFFGAWAFYIPAEKIIEKLSPITLKIASYIKL